jgi:hypothetical protein
MSVLACSRAGCEHIMCDRYSEEYGYLCEDCFEEAVQNGIVPGTIEVFMASEKRPDHSTAIRACLNEIFTLR